MNNFSILSILEKSLKKSLCLILTNSHKIVDRILEALIGPKFLKTRFHIISLLILLYLEALYLIF